MSIVMNMKENALNSEGVSKVYIKHNMWDRDVSYAFTWRIDVSNNPVQVSVKACFPNNLRFGESLGNKYISLWPQYNCLKII